MTTQGSPAASSLKQLHCHEEDFSEFTQGPSVADQENFGHFQGSQPSLSQFGGLYQQYLRSTLGKFIMLGVVCIG